MHKPKVAVHKFSSCDGCQLAFLNAGQALLQVAEQVEFVHFAEAGLLNESAPVDIAFIEGSVSTAHDLARLHIIRAVSRQVISIGACATAGGIQALRNLHDGVGWHQAIYASPAYLDSLATVQPIASVIKVDGEIWGCPVNMAQVLQTIAAFFHAVKAVFPAEKVCAECKRRGNVCVTVSRGVPCLGTVTRAGCGAICPTFERGCYGCYGPQGVIYAGSA